MPGPGINEESTEPTEGELEQATTGLTFRVARSLDDVLSAWQMVYTAYRRKELINPNPYRIHTAPQALSPHTAVIMGCLGPLTVSTLTAYVDSPAGLPLDRVYPEELQGLRGQGRTLLEVGLFADRRKHLARTAEALFQLMRFAFYFGLQLGMTDFVIGVHPRHARFYVRALGFDYWGDEKTYAAVRDHPVVLLRGDIREKISRKPLHPALDYFQKNPVSQETFDQRFSFEPQQVAGSILESFLASRVEATVSL